MEGLIEFVFIRYLLNSYTVPALVEGTVENGNKQERLQVLRNLPSSWLFWGREDLGYTTQQVVTVYTLGG